MNSTASPLVHRLSNSDKISEFTEYHFKVIALILGYVTGLVFFLNPLLLTCAGVVLHVFALLN